MSNLKDKDEPTDMEISRLYKIRKTELQMMEARGYGVGKKDKEITYEQFKSQFFTQYRLSNKQIPLLNFFGSKINDDSSCIFVEYIAEEKLNVGHIEKFCNKLKRGRIQGEINENEMENEDNGNSIQNGIIILSGVMTPLAKQKLKETNDTKAFHIEVFEDRELIVNITEHELVPEHKILSDEDKQTLLKKYRLKESQLPKILTTDPVARFLGLIKGQVVKITRASETAGRYVTYRIAQ